MHHTARDRKSLLGHELDGAVFEVDEEPAVDNVEELIIGIVLVPVILTLEDAQANNRFVHLAERLVVPLEFASVGKSFRVSAASVSRPGLISTTRAPLALASAT